MMKGLFGHYIPPDGIENLHRYKYVSGHRTPLDRIMNSWWDFVERRIPDTVHPNTLTVSSCLSVLLGTCLLIAYSPYLYEEAPRWVLICAGILFFCYQTLDAIDGKHARRLGISSPLGQLMDHGCDILCTTPMTLLGTAIIGAGVGFRQYFVSVLSTQMLQFLYTVSLRKPLFGGF